ncbi:MAG: hypothetical protein EAZ55_08975 [Cytophagales bacterium]|nr:MAG: hypothetical protein EAZ55_08975 [Cytophagales bacterium]
MTIQTLLFENECRKHLSNRVYWFIVLFPCTWVLLAFFSMLSMPLSDFRQIVSLTSGDFNPSHFYQNSLKTPMRFLLTIYYVALVIYVVDVEHSGNTWKYLFTLPIKPKDIIWAKFFFLIVSVLFSFVLFNIFFIISQALLEHYRSDFGYERYPNNAWIVTIMIIKIYFTSFFNIICILLLTLRLQDYGLVFLIAILVHFVPIPPYNPFNLYFTALGKQHFLLKQQGIENFNIIYLFDFKELLILCAFLIPYLITSFYSHYLIKS